MFTGIVEEIGRIAETGKRICVLCKDVLDGLKVGDSIAVSGVCLTVVGIDKDSFSAELSDETLKITNLSILKKGGFVNLERALKIGDRLGGHFVTGHIDDLATLYEKRNNLYYFRTQPSLSRYITKKGSIAVDGVSLTIVDAFDEGFSVGIIPYTLEKTTFKYMKLGYKANIETDILTKTIDRLLKKESLTTLLKNEGFII
ncbi:TPA: riboflavin synthase [bacterium]|nr:riboflavin synthase [bacterium]